jgi:hypothetical protein
MVQRWRSLLISNGHYLEEDRMRFATTLALALGAGLAVPMSAYVSKAATLAHKHQIHTRRHVQGFVDPVATGLAPAIAIVPATQAPKPDWVREGLSGNPDECARYGCIGY